MQSVLDSSSNAVERKRMEAGLSFMAWLKSEAGGTDKTAAFRYKGIGQKPVAPITQQASAGVRTGLPKAAVGRAAKVDIPNVDMDSGVAKGTLKRASIEGLLRGVLRGVLRGGASAGSTVSGALKGVARSAKDEAAGFAHGSVGLRDEFGALVKEPGALRRFWNNKIKYRGQPGKHLLSDKELARRRGPDYMSGYVRGKNIADSYGTPSMYDKMNTSFRRPDGSFSVGSVLGGLSDTGVLSSEAIANAVGKTTGAVSGIPAAQAAEAHRRKMLTYGGLAAGGLGAGLIGSHLLRKKSDDTNQ